MSSSLVRGKYIVCEAGTDADSSVVIADGAVFQRHGIIEDVGPSRNLVSLDHVSWHGTPDFLRAFGFFG